MKKLVTGIFILVTAVARLSSGAGLDHPGSPTMSLPETYRPFTSESPWNTPIAPNTPVDPFSDHMIARLQTAAYRIEASTRKWTIPIFVIDSGQSPLLDVPSTRELLFEIIDPDNTGIAHNIPMPEGIWPDPGADGHMVLVDTVRHLCWEFTRAHKGIDSTWTASIVDIWDLKGPGFRKAFTGNNWWRSGATGAGIPLISGIIRPEEVESGEIKHALLCATPINRKAAFKGGPLQICSPPASRTDGHGIGLDFIPAGARIQLDPTLDLDALNLSPGTQVLAHAMQKYGMFVGMNAPTFKVFCQNLGPDNPVWQHYQDFKDLDRIPLKAFRVLACEYAYK